MRWTAGRKSSGLSAARANSGRAVRITSQRSWPTFCNCRHIMNPPTGNASRRLSVRHTTRYTYDRPVTRSSHRLRLRPITDRKQTVLDHVLEVSLPVQKIEYDDVFGNMIDQFEITEPYT